MIRGFDIIRPAAAPCKWERPTGKPNADRRRRLIGRALARYYLVLDTTGLRSPTHAYHEKLYAESIGRMNKRAIRIVSA